MATTLNSQRLLTLHHHYVEHPMSDYLIITLTSIFFFVLGDVFGLDGLEVAYYKIVGLF